MNGTRLRSRRARTGGRRRIGDLKGDGVATEGSEFTSVNGEAPDGCRRDATGSSPMDDGPARRPNDGRISLTDPDAVDTETHPITGMARHVRASTSSGCFR